MRSRSARALVLGAAAAALLGWHAAVEAAPAPTVVRVVIDGGITNATRDYVLAALRHAEAASAAALLIELDTPGGLLDATRGIVHAELRARVPIVVFVWPVGGRAGSAGLFVTLAAHVAAMAPSTNIGAAHPVSAFGGDVEGAMGDKVVNDTAAWARALAQTRRRDSESAEKAVKESASWTAGEAVERKLVDLVAANPRALLQAIDGRKLTVAGVERVLRTRHARIESFERSGQQLLYDFLADPVLLYVLLLVGLLGIYIEIQSPGLIVPGAVGAICLLLVLGLQALPLNGFGLLLIGLAALLLVAEVYLTSFGVLGIAGLCSLVIGSYMLFDVPGSSFRLPPAVIWSVALAMAALMLVIGLLIVRVKRQGATSGPEALVGRHAVVSEAIDARGTGKIFFDGTYWNATAEVPIDKGARVRVDAFEGLRVRVSKLAEKEEGT